MAQSRCLLLEVVEPHHHQEWAVAGMEELEQLVLTFGGAVVEKSIQHRVHPHPSTYIGPGKVAWLQQRIVEQKIDIIVLNDIVNSGQLFRLEKSLWEANTRIKVWDRVDLILNIFEQHASSTEAKLQIRVAQLQHLGPRAYGLGTSLSRQGGGIGTRGLGETNIERERRAAKRQLQRLREELKRLAKGQADRISGRQRRGLQTVALVGYTSAGKTSLFNVLTQKQRTVSKALFTTLDSVVGRFRPQGRLESLIVSDTIGFINNLPPVLVDAFKSTLLESVSAELLLHVVDGMDPHVHDKLQAVESLLLDLDPKQSPPLLVFSKSDLLTLERRKALESTYHYRDFVFVSAVTGDGLPVLKERIARLARK